MPSPNYSSSPLSSSSVLAGSEDDTNLIASYGFASKKVEEFDMLLGQRKIAA